MKSTLCVWHGTFLSWMFDIHVYCDNLQNFLCSSSWHSCIVTIWTVWTDPGNWADQQKKLTTCIQPQHLCVPDYQVGLNPGSARSQPIESMYWRGKANSGLLHRHSLSSSHKKICTMNPKTIYVDSRLAYLWFCLQFLFSPKIKSRGDPTKATERFGILFWERREVKERDWGTLIALEMN